MMNPPSLNWESHLGLPCRLTFCETFEDRLFPHHLDDDHNCVKSRSDRVQVDIHGVKPFFAEVGRCCFEACTKTLVSSPNLPPKISPKRTHISGHT